jgi:hypothetical protein
MLPLSQRDYDYLGIKYFVENNFDVSVLETPTVVLFRFRILEKPTKSMIGFTKFIIDFIVL